MTQGDTTIVAGPQGVAMFSHGLGVKPLTISTASLEDGNQVIDGMNTPTGQYAFGVEGFNAQDVIGTLWDRNSGDPAPEGATLDVHWTATLSG